MEEYFVDLSDVSDRKSLHESLKKSLPLPPWYGSNLDALYDALTDMTDPVIIHFLGWEHLLTDLPAYFGSFRRVLEDAQREVPGLFCFWDGNGEEKGTNCAEMDDA